MKVGRICSERPSSPAVTLSPNARNRRMVSDSGLSVTENEQVARRWRASVAVQPTTVVPTGKPDPVAGVQIVVTGSAPPATTGGLYVTGWIVPTTPGTVNGAGQVSCGGAGIVGLFGPS